MRLLPEETEGGPWCPRRTADVLHDLLRDAEPGRTAVLAVDGRSGSGKTTLADRLAAVGGGTVVHTDDVAWNHSFFGWQERLVRFVLEPVRAGIAVDRRPTEWPDDKPGAIRVAAGTPLLVVEGVGASAAPLAGLLDAAVWVQSDLDDAERRGIERDVRDGRSPEEARRFWDRWADEELPFLARDRPWDRADLVVLGGGGSADEVLVGRLPGR